MDRPDETKLAAPRKPWFSFSALRPRSRRTRIAVALAAALAFGGAGYYGWQTYGAGSETARFTTVAVQRGDLEDTVTATGILQPRDYVDVGTQVSGQVKKLAVQVGTSVKKGQLIAEIDS